MHGRDEGVTLLEVRYGSINLTSGMCSLRIMGMIELEVKSQRQ